VRLTDWEEERLLIFSAAELGRRHRAAGLALNAPEAVAIICDAMLEAARAGSSYEDVEAAGRNAVSIEEVMLGVRDLIDEVRLEVLMGDGTRLVALVDPLGGGVDGGPPEPGPGAVIPAAVEIPDPNVGRERIRLSVQSTSARAIRVSSHYPFDRVNARLVFDREAARGFRLDLPAGASLKWAPGERLDVDLIRYGGDR
jgi:urease subunit gamma/beta